MKFLKTRIADKLVAATILFGLMVTLLVSGIQVYLDYRGHIQKLEARLNQQLDSSIDDVAQVLDSGSGEKVTPLLDDILTNPDIDYGRVTVESGQNWLSGRESEGDYLHISRKHFSTGYSPGNRGVFELGVDSSPVRGEVLSSFYLTLLQNGLKVFLITGFMFYLTQKLVTKHLVSIANQVRENDIARGHAPVRLKRSSFHDEDELDQLVAGINTMQERGWQAYNDLGKSEQRLLLFFEATEEGILGVERDGTCSFANDACLRILGLDGYEAVLGAELTSLFSYTSFDQEYSESKALIQEAYEKICAVESADGVLKRPDGTTGYISLRAYPVFNDGECSGAIAFFRDISKERQLNQERALLSEAVQQAPVMVVITSQENVIEYVNPGVVHSTGFSSSELIGRDLGHLIDYTNPEEKKLIDDRLLSAKPWQGVLKQHTRYGTTLMVSAVLSPIFNSLGGGNNRVCVFRDMTYEIQLQKQLINSKKMEAVDRLSSSIAHELGNPLFGIRSVIKDLKDRQNVSDKDRELLDMAYQECNRMNQLVRELRTLDQDGESIVQDHDINEILEQVLVITRYNMEQNGVKAVLDLEEDLPRLLVDRKQLVLAFINLINNSIESMTPGGGTIRIRADRGDDTIDVCIGDSGGGIEQEHRELIFEPFFSTKPQVEGTGLGLTVAYSIIRGLGGDISFTSELGSGTIFCVHLPKNT
ncbi:PAS domain S-box protein [Desulfopila sp. IMCC35008]|uniref:PAS domain S-box protein n=1 Tax=Desulfopila sp. IMCC35008 TaxID=2653858 RepID=UPI0013CFBECF|nr:PAS domain S-box protein [Desulfopila sp. IMCC35008]